MNLCKRCLLTTGVDRLVLEVLDRECSMPVSLPAVSQL